MHFLVKCIRKGFHGTTGIEHIILALKNRRRRLRSEILTEELQMLVLKTAQFDYRSWTNVNGGFANLGMINFYRIRRIAKQNNLMNTIPNGHNSWIRCSPMKLTRWFWRKVGFVLDSGIYLSNVFWQNWSFVQMPGFWPEAFQ